MLSVSSSRHPGGHFHIQAWLRKGGLAWGRKFRSHGCTDGQEAAEQNALPSTDLHLLSCPNHASSVSGATSGPGMDGVEEVGRPNPAN